jgi:hypothetical protein
MSKLIYVRDVVPVFTAWELYLDEVSYFETLRREELKFVNDY